MQSEQSGCESLRTKPVPAWGLQALLAVGLCVPSAYAQNACPAPAAWQAASLAQLAGWSEACDDNAFFHAHRGAQLLAQGQTEAAAVSLEKALLINPDLPGAQLDYAQALAQIGLKGSARAILNEVLQRPDIQPGLKAQLSPAQSASQSAAQSTMQGTAQGTALPWQWNSLLQTAYGRESNLNSATYTDSLTLYLSNGPVTLGLTDNAKPVAGDAFKTTAAVQGHLKGAEGQELSVNVALASKTGAASVGGNNRTAEGAVKYSLPMLAGNASGVWQMAAGGTQFWLGNQTAYQDQGLQLKFAWDTLGAACKWAPAIGRIDQKFPQSASLNGVYTYGRMDWVCSSGQNRETHVALGGGQDKAQDTSRPGGNRTRTDLLVRHEQIVNTPAWPAASGQLSAWLRYAHSQDKLAYSDLLGDLKSDTHRTDLGLGYWVPVAKQWSAGINLEATSQRSNNTLFNLRNSSVYVGARWASD
ncbi:MAG: tetratricopeptide repeat protein [Limnohabitans sp.]